MGENTYLLVGTYSYFDWSGSRHEFFTPELSVFNNVNHWCTRKRSLCFCTRAKTGAATKNEIEQWKGFVFECEKMCWKMVFEWKRCPKCVSRKAEQKHLYTQTVAFLLRFCCSLHALALGRSVPLARALHIVFCTIYAAWAYTPSNCNNKKRPPRVLSLAPPSKHTNTLLHNQCALARSHTPQPNCV